MTYNVFGGMLNPTLLLQLLKSGDMVPQFKNWVTGVPHTPCFHVNYVYERNFVFVDVSGCYCVFLLVILSHCIVCNDF